MDPVLCVYYVNIILSKPTRINFPLSCQVKYKRDFEESRGRGFSIVTDTPELQRLKRTQEQISNVGALCRDDEVALVCVCVGRSVRLSLCGAWLLQVCPISSEHTSTSPVKSAA